MKEAIFKIIDKFTEGVDVYHTKTSMWLIFTDKKEWVIELTNKGTLWYNYNFFIKCFRYVSLDVVDNQHYITEWVEDTIQNGVRHTLLRRYGATIGVEDTIQNGVRHTSTAVKLHNAQVEDTIQNGVRHTYINYNKYGNCVEDTIQNGVKETIHCSVSNDENSREALQNGIKITDSKSLSEQQVKRVIRKSKALGQSEVTEKEINKVIKETHDDAYHNSAIVEGAINNGIKETRYDATGNPSHFKDVIRDGIKETKRWMRFKRDVTPIIETNWRKVDNHPTYLDNIIDESNCSSK